MCNKGEQWYDWERIADRVAEIFSIARGEVFSKGRHKRKVKARSLLCYWAVREAAVPLRTLAKRLGISAPCGVGDAGEKLTYEKKRYALQ